jgi:hypothetical protein
VSLDLLNAARRVLKGHTITDLEDGGLVYVDALALADLRDEVRAADSELSAGGLGVPGDVLLNTEARTERSWNSAVTRDKVKPGDGRQWCPVCKLYHRHVGERTDAGHTTRPCPLLPASDSRNYS